MTSPKRGAPATLAASLATCTVVCTVVLASCGGANYIGGSSVTTSASVTSGTVDVKSVKGYGKILVTSSGVSLYLLTSDPSGGSSCIGSCAIVWPPLIANGKLKAGPGSTRRCCRPSAAVAGGGRSSTTSTPFIPTKRTLGRAWSPAKESRRTAASGGWCHRMGTPLLEGPPDLLDEVWLTGSALPARRRPRLGHQRNPASRSRLYPAHG